MIRDSFSAAVKVLGLNCAWNSQRHAVEGSITGDDFDRARRGHGAVADVVCGASGDDVVVGRRTGPGEFVGRIGDGGEEVTILEEVHFLDEAIEVGGGGSERDRGIGGKDGLGGRVGQGDSGRVVAGGEDGLKPVEVADIAAVGRIAVHDDAHDLRAGIENDVGDGNRLPGLPAGGVGDGD